MTTAHHTCGACARCRHLAALGLLPPPTTTLIDCTRGPWLTEATHPLPPPDLGTREIPQPPRPAPWTHDYEQGYDSGYWTGFRLGARLGTNTDAPDQRPPLIVGHMPRCTCGPGAGHWVTCPTLGLVDDEPTTPVPPRGTQ